jgi:hypothetical protein
LEIMPFAKFIIGAPIPPQKAKPSNSFKKWHPRYRMDVCGDVSGDLC